jgi:hypothetical protein
MSATTATTNVSGSWFDFNKIKGYFSFSDPSKELKKAEDNLNKINIECEEKQKIAKNAVDDAKKAEAEAAKAVTTGGKGRRKGTRKPKGKKNKKTRRS